MNKEKKFVPKPGQTDFTNIRYCPVINCVIKHRRKILVVQRSAGMRLYPGYWNGISGFLDDKRSFDEKVRDEIGEELGLKKKDILSITMGKIFHQEAPKYKKTWIVHPVLVEVGTDKITLDWEAQNYQWVFPKEVMRLKLLPGFDQVLRSFFKQV